MITLIGMGVTWPTKLPNERIEEIQKSDLLIGAEKFLGQFNHLNIEKILLTSNLSSLLDIIKNNIHKNIVILTSGDPNLYGISNFVLKNFPPETIFIHPNVSTMQIAFAKAKISMNDAAIISVHGRDINRVRDVIKKHHKVGIFTSNKNTPLEIANILKNNNYGNNIDIYICENLGNKTENIIKTDVNSISKLNFSPLNIVILLKKNFPDFSPTGLPLLGTPDHLFFHRTGMITKSEIRVLDISKMILKNNSTVWDIGAGCGSLSIESASIAKDGIVFSIEKKKEQTDLIEQNIDKFKSKNIKVIHGSAPEVLNELPHPNRIFIGGTGGNIREILKTCDSKINTDGVIVINVVMLNTLIEGTSALKELGYSFDITTVNISKTKKITDNYMFKASSPIFIICAIKR